jgi:hypothetical protein
MFQGDQDNSLRGSGAAGDAAGSSHDDDDPISQLGEWVTIPDLAPGQSDSESAVFLDQPNKRPNDDNPQLEIHFEPVKAN